MKPITLLICLLVATRLLFAQSPAYLDATASLPVSVVTGQSMDVISEDLDGDGDLDIVLAREAQKNWILWNDGKGIFAPDPSRAFTQVKTYPQGFGGEDSEDVAAFDAEGDGDLDLLFVTEDTDLHEFFLNDGKGNFSLAPFQFPKPANSNALLTLDVNGDSFEDVIIGQNGNNALYLNQQNGSFLLDSTEILPLNADWTQDLKAGDLDGDGDLDLVEGCDAGNTHIYFYENGAFVVGDHRLPTDLDSLETRKVLLEDVDADGDVDIFLCNVGWNPTRKAQDALLINDGQGNFVEETATRFPYFHLITLDGVFHDFNDDSLPDLLIIGASELTNYTLYLNDAQHPGNFMPVDTLLPFFVMGTAISLDLADYNGDGREDIYFGVMQAPDRLLLGVPPAATQLEDLSTHLRLFPNPAHTHLTIQYPFRAKGTVYALDGKRVKEELDIRDGSRIEIGELPDGVYVLKVHAQTHPSVEIKFEKITK